MPVLPRQEGTISPGVLNLPQVSPESYGAGIGRAISDIGKVMGEIAAQAQAQQDDIDAAKLSSQLDEGLDNLKETIKEEPDYNKREGLYREKATELFTSINDQARSRDVKARIGRYFPSVLSRQLIDVRHETQKLWGQQRISDTDALADILAERISKSGDPQEATKLGLLYENTVLGLATGPAAPLTLQQAKKKMDTFRIKTKVSQMQYMSRTDPNKLFEMTNQGLFEEVDPDTRLSILSTAREGLDAEDARQQGYFKAIQDAVENVWSARANEGRLSEADLNFALTGKHPYINPDKARALKEVNDKPPTGEGVDQIRAIMTEYHLGPSTIQRINNTRQQLKALQRQGIKGTLLSQAADELQTDQRTMESIGVADLNRKITDADLKYRLESGKSIIPGIMSRMQENQQALDRAEIRRRIQAGEDGDKIVTEILERNKAKLDQIPQRDKNVIDLVK